jgi:hypothetical protein
MVKRRGLNLADRCVASDVWPLLGRRGHEPLQEALDLEVVAPVAGAYTPNPI